MVFSEVGVGANDDADKSLPTLEAELSGINCERSQLCSGIENQWLDIPTTVISYLAANCPKPKLMSAAIAEIRLLLSDNPTAFSDPDMVGPLVDGCITNVQLKAVNDRTQEQIDGNTLRATKNSVVEGISNQTADLKGRAKLDAAIALLNNPEIPATIREDLSAQFARIGSTLDEMSTVFTDEASQAEFQSIVSRTSFDLGASSTAITLTPIMDKVEASSTFTDDQKIRLRQIVIGSDAQDTLNETVTDENGISRPRYSQKHQREIRNGVSGYVQGHNRQMIEARAGNRMITKDVTGWSGEDVGFLIEATHMWNMYDSFGVTGFIEDVYKIDFSILGDGNAFDPIQITHLRQVLSHLTGSFEGYDGDIANLSEHRTLIQNQSRLLSETQTALGFENDRSGTTKVLRRLGLEDENGKSNLQVIKSFGDYTREQYGSGAPDQLRLVEYLHRLHPELVKPLSKEDATGKLGGIGEAQ